MERPPSRSESPEAAAVEKTRLQNDLEAFGAQCDEAIRGEWAKPPILYRSWAEVSERIARTYLALVPLDLPVKAWHDERLSRASELVGIEAAWIGKGVTWEAFESFMQSGGKAIQVQLQPSYFKGFMGKASARHQFMQAWERRDDYQLRRWDAIKGFIATYTDGDIRDYCHRHGIDLGKPYT